MTDESYRMGDEIEAVCEQYRQGAITRERAEIIINKIYPPQPEEKLKKFQKTLQAWNVRTMGRRPFVLIPDWARMLLDKIDDAKVGKPSAKGEAIVPWQVGPSTGGGDEGEEKLPEEEELEGPEDDASEEDDDE